MILMITKMSFIFLKKTLKNNLSKSRNVIQAQIKLLCMEGDVSFVHICSIRHFKKPLFRESELKCKVRFPIGAN